MAGLIPHAPPRLQRTLAATAAALLPENGTGNNATNGENWKLFLRLMNPLNLKNTTENFPVARALKADKDNGNGNFSKILSVHNELAHLQKKIFASKKTVSDARQNNGFLASLLPRLREYFSRLSMKKNMAEKCHEHRWQLQSFRDELRVITRLTLDKLDLPKPELAELKKKCAAEVELTKLQVAKLESAKREFAELSKKYLNKLELAQLNSQAPPDITAFLVKQAEVLVGDLQAAEKNKEILLLTQTLTQMNEIKILEDHIDSLRGEIGNKAVQEIDAEVVQKHTDNMLSFIYKLELKYATDANSLAEILRGRLDSLRNEQQDGADTSVNMLLDGASEKLGAEIDLLKNQQNTMAEKQNRLETLQNELRELRKEYDQVAPAITRTEEAIVKQQEAISQFTDSQNNLKRLLREEIEANDRALQEANSNQGVSPNLTQNFISTFKKLAAGIPNVITGVTAQENKGALAKFDQLKTKIKEIFPEPSWGVVETVTNYVEEKKKELREKLAEMEGDLSEADLKNFLLSQYATVVADVDPKILQPLKNKGEALNTGLRELKEKMAVQRQDKQGIIERGKVPVERLITILPSAVTDKQAGQNVNMKAIDEEIIQIATAVQKIVHQGRELETLQADIAMAYQRENSAINQQE